MTLGSSIKMRTYLGLDNLSVIFEASIDTNKLHSFFQRFVFKVFFLIISTKKLPQRPRIMNLKIATLLFSLHLLVFAVKCIYNLFTILSRSKWINPSNKRTYFSSLNPYFSFTIKLANQSFTREE